MRVARGQKRGAYAADVPGGDVLVEDRCALEHLVRARDGAQVPRAQRLVEGRRAVERPVHELHLPRRASQP
eukprot:2810947-Rhodomonas_salina.1